EERRGALSDVALVVVDLLDDEPLRDGLPRQRAPARALDVERRLAELVAETLERAERLVDRSGELTVGLVAAVRAHGLPEQRVQDVARQVEGQVLLELVDRAELFALARGGELLERGVRAFAVR